MKLPSVSLPFSLPAKMRLSSNHMMYGMGMLVLLLILHALGGSFRVLEGFATDSTQLVVSNTPPATPGSSSSPATPSSSPPSASTLPPSSGPSSTTAPRAGANVLDADKDGVPASSPALVSKQSSFVASANKDKRGGKESAVMPAKKEGFVSMGRDLLLNGGESSVYDLDHNDVVDLSTWQLPSSQPGHASSITAYANKPYKQRDDEMLIFADTPFKPECCPNTYTSSTGCACLSNDQSRWLATRGGNNR